MGQTIEQIALKRGHQIVLIVDKDDTDYDITKADVAIDFTSTSSSTIRITVGRLTSSRSAMAVREIGLSLRMISRIAERLISRMSEAVMVRRYAILPC